MTRGILVACVLATALFAFGGVSYQEGKDAWVVGAAKGRAARMRITVQPFGKGFGRLVKVAEDGDSIRMDMREAFKAGASMVRLYTEGYDLSRIAGKDVVFESEWTLPAGVAGMCVIEGADADKKHWWKKLVRLVRKSANTPRRTCRALTSVPKDLRALHSRFDISSAGAGEIVFHSHRATPANEYDLDSGSGRTWPQELLFHATLDGVPLAETAKGSAAPTVAKDLEFVDGKKGKALRLTAANRSQLAFAVKGNVDPARGTMSFWSKREWTNPAHTTDPLRWKHEKHCVFAMSGAGNLLGAGALRLEWDDNFLSLLRGDVDGKEELYRRMPYNGKWRFCTVTWDEYGMAMYCDGEKMPYGREPDSAMPFRAVRAMREPLVFEEGAAPLTDLFFGNSPDGKRPFEGCVDDIRIWSQPMDEREAKALFEKENGGPPATFNGWDEPFDPSANPLHEGNQYLAHPVSKAGVPGRLELVERITFDTPAVFDDASRFRKVGKVFARTLDGRAYLETELNNKDIEPRFAVRLKLDKRAPLHLIEVDYPDDAVRSMDVVAQFCKRPNGVTLYPYVMQSGVMSGAEYPLSGKIATQRFLYWTEEEDTAVIFRAMRFSTAAAAEMRVYKVVDGALPEAKMNLPSAEDRRHFALFFEDPAIERHFSVNFASPGRTQDCLDRIVAYMKYFGQDMLCYPGVWYHGLICDRYMPRNHPPHFLKEICRRFDRDGLYLMPTFNLQTLRYDNVELSRKSIDDGSLHPTLFAIQSTGRPKVEGWHGSPPAFNIAHPDAQAQIRQWLKDILDDCAGHGSFKGICLHLTRVVCLWWGDIESGYNDYCIEAFEKASGVAVPVDRKDPARGRLYAEWLNANAYDAWVAWRCDVLTDFYRLLDADMKARRGDLRLWIMAKPDIRGLANGRKGWDDPRIFTKLLREAGLDAEKLRRAIPDVIFGDMERYGWWRDEIRGGKGSEAARNRVRDMLYDPDYYAEMMKCGYPAITMYDSYFESPIGAAKGVNRLSGDWLEETPWRVSVLNPVGRHALRDYALALKYGDVLEFAKGGFLIGTYGTEEFVTPWMQAFRSLPAVKFSTLPLGTDKVVLRGARHKGVEYRYLVNVTPDDQTIKATMPDGMRDAVSGEPAGGTREFSLAPWELRAFR